MKPAIRRPPIQFMPLALTRGGPPWRIEPLRPALTHPEVRSIESGASALPLEDIDPVEQANFAVDPYEDYAITLTPEGGIAVAYKTIDDGLGQMFLRIALWILATSLAGWLCFTQSPAPARWVNLVAFLIVAVLNALIVSKPRAVYRVVEVRPDCMIVDGNDTFFLEHMAVAWPAFEERADEFVLCGVYGTRFVEYLKLPRFDEFDRAPEVFARHLQYAMEQMWTGRY